MEKSLKILDFDKILFKISEYAVLKQSRDRILEIRPLKDIKQVKFYQNTIFEADLLLNKYGVPSPIYFDDLTDILERVKLGSVLNCKDLLKVAFCLKSCRMIKSSILSINDEKISILKQYADNIVIYENLEKELFSKIISEDKINDKASDTLYGIRNRIKKINERIREKLSNYVHQDTRKYLQDGIVTIRGDRFVLPVKAEFKGQVKGLIHDQSSSGATLYIEPEAIVSLNNDLKLEFLNEQIEIERILKELSSKVSLASRDLEFNILNVCDIDIAFAKAEYAYKNKCTMPKMNTRGVVDIKNGRHPLIDRAEVVPVSLVLGKSYRYLLITGPNTGGKTVSLKLLGLFELLGMSGLYVFADEDSELAMFENVFCDVGDEQSIEQSLSTFSSHIKNIINITNNATENSLVLIDEIGAGTDPDEGSALALAIIDYLLEKGSYGIITTHYSKLKEYAFVNEQIENASMEFDSVTFKPLYRLNIGTAGVSNAIEISKRLGLSKDIISLIPNYLDVNKISFENVLRNAEMSRIDTEKERERLLLISAEKEKELALIKETREKLERERENFLKNAKVESRRLVNEKAETAEELLKEIKDIYNKAEISSQDIVRASTLKNKLENEVYSFEEGEQIDFNEEINLSTLKKGDLVYLLTFEKNAVFDSKLKNGKVSVLLNGKRLEVSETSLKKPLKENKPKEKKVLINRSSAMQSFKSEINIVGLRVEEATDKLETFLQNALVSGAEEVKIIHGVGTGILIKTVREILKEKKYVKEFRFGKYGEGDRGVTIVTFK